VLAVLGAKAIIFNNLVLGGRFDYSPASPFDSKSDYNAWASSSPYFNVGGTNNAHGLNLVGVASTTIFADPANRDYRLKSGSPAINAGTNLSAYGNLSFSNDIQNETRTGTWDIGADEYVQADITPPVISAIGTTTAASIAIITWTTDENSTSTVRYGLTSAYGSASSSNALVTSHSIRLTNLAANTTYHYRVESTDASGNRATSTDKIFTTISAVNVYYSVGQMLTTSRPILRPSPLPLAWQLSQPRKRLPTWSRRQNFLRLCRCDDNRLYFRQAITNCLECNYQNGRPADGHNNCRCLENFTRL